MKTEITRTQLKEIHDIACKDWKSKISAYGAKDPFSETIKFSEKEIQEMVNACTPEQLPIVKEVFNVTDTFESIKTVEDACKHLGEIDSEVRELRLLQNIPNINRRTLAGQELIVITKALNSGWTVDFDDYQQNKFILWWYLGKNFRLHCVFECVMASCVGAPLCHKSKEVANYSAKQFKSIWKDYLN
jgi:hypothetical protein